nr:uncharacterized protein LOC123493975 [Aegilops tauschii subsp. strangulata]
MHLLLDDKKELINARRRATYLKNKENADINKEQMKSPLVDGYRRKYDDAAGKHLHQNMPAVDMSGMQNVPRSALGDITNGVQAHPMLLADKNSQIKAQGRATVKHKDDNLPALTISADPNRSSYTSLSQDEAVLPHTNTISTAVIHDNQLPRKQRGKQRRTCLTPDQMEQTNARRRATYRKHLEHGTIDLEEKNTTLREWRACSKEKGELSAKRRQLMRQRSTPRAKNPSHCHVQT